MIIFIQSLILGIKLKLIHLNTACSFRKPNYSIWTVKFTLSRKMFILHTCFCSSRNYWSYDVSLLHLTHSKCNNRCQLKSPCALRNVCIHMCVYICVCLCTGVCFKWTQFMTYPLSIHCLISFVPSALCLTSYGTSTKFSWCSNLQKNLMQNICVWPFLPNSQLLENSTSFALTYEEV